jgi:hypothetical protein
VYCFKSRKNNPVPARYNSFQIILLRRTILLKRKVDRGWMAAVTNLSRPVGIREQAAREILPVAGEKSVSHADFERRRSR